MVARASSVEEPRLKPTDVVCRLRLSSFWRVSPRLGLRREVVYGLGLEPQCLLPACLPLVMAFPLNTRAGFHCVKLIEYPLVLFYGCSSLF